MKPERAVELNRQLDLKKAGMLCGRRCVWSQLPSPSLRCAMNGRVCCRVASGSPSVFDSTTDLQIGMAIRWGRDMAAATGKAASVIT